MVLGLTFKSFIYLKLIFVSGVKKGTSFILLQVNNQFFHHDLLTWLSFLHWVFLGPFSNTNWLHVYRLISGLLILFHGSMCLFLFQHHAVLISIASYYSFKCRSVMSPSLLFFLRFALVIWVLLCSV